MTEANTAVMKSISTALGMAPLILDETPNEEATEIIPIEEPELSKEDKEAEEDFYLTRENTRELLEKGMEALDGILRIASASEHPRAFEVAANLLKTVQDMNAGLLKLHEQRRQLVPPAVAEKPPTAPTSITNNGNMFFGTTQEMLDMIEAREIERQNKIIEHDP